MLKIQLIGILIFLIGFALPKNTLAQFNVYGQESHGGDLIASEFIIIAQKIQSMIDKTPELFLPRSRFSLQYSDYLSRVKILVFDKVYLEGREVMAVNMPGLNPAEIHISRNLWKYSELNIEDYELFVLHEILPGLLIHDNEFRQSIEIIRRLRYWSNMNLKTLMENHAFMSLIEATLSYDYLISQNHINKRNRAKDIYSIATKTFHLKNENWSIELYNIAHILIENLDPNQKYNPLLSCAAQLLKSGTRPSQKLFYLELLDIGVDDSVFCPVSL